MNDQRIISNKSGKKLLYIRKLKIDIGIVYRTALYEIVSLPDVKYYLKRPREESIRTM